MIFNKLFLLIFLELIDLRERKKSIKYQPKVIN